MKHLSWIVEPYTIGDVGMYTVSDVQMYTNRYKGSSNFNHGQGSTLYVAASWSWASSSFGVQLWEDESQDKTTELSTLLHYELDFTGTDAFDQIKSGYIKIRGPLFEVDVFIRHSEISSLARNGSTFLCYTRMDIEPPEDEWTGSFFFLSLFVHPMKWDHKIDDQVYGLLLRPASEVPGWVSRAGICIVEDPKIDVVFLFSEHRQIATLPESSFHPDYGHTINII